MVSMLMGKEDRQWGDFGIKWAGQTDRCTMYLHTGNPSSTKCGPEKSEGLTHQVTPPGEEVLLRLLKASPLTTHILLIRKWRPLGILGLWLLRSWAASTPAQDDFPLAHNFGRTLKQNRLQGLYRAMLSFYHMPGPSAKVILFNLTALWDRSFEYPFFTDEECKVLRAGNFWWGEGIISFVCIPSSQISSRYVLSAQYVLVEWTSSRSLCYVSEGASTGTQAVWFWLSCYNMTFCTHLPLWVTVWWCLLVTVLLVIVSLSPPPTLWVAWEKGITPHSSCTNPPSTAG